MFCLSLVGFWLLLTAAVILYILLGKPGKFLLDINPIFFRLPLPNVNDRRFKRNWQLAIAQKLFPDRIINPKSLAFCTDDGRKFFIGSTNGHVYLVDDNAGTIESVAHFPNNGRPLGMRFCGGVLYFIEANSGLYKYDPGTKSLEHLLPLDQTRFLDGKPSMFFDDLAVSDDGDQTVIYITDVSRKFTVDMWCYIYLEPDTTGRILRFNTATKSVATLVENLCFPNGIELTDGGRSLLICELTKRRLLKYELKGPDAGRISIFMDNLPGEPENIRRSQNDSMETYWVGLALTRDYNNEVSFLDDFATEPNLRKLILRSCFILGNILHKIGYFFHSDILKNRGTNLKIGLALILDDFGKNPGMAIEIDTDGTVQSSFQIQDDKSVISEIQEVPKRNSSNERVLYTTSSGGSLCRITL